MRVASTTIAHSVMNTCGLTRCTRMGGFRPSHPPNPAEGSLCLDIELSPLPDLASPETDYPQERQQLEDQGLPSPLDFIGEVPLVTATNVHLIKSASDNTAARRQESR